MEILILCASKFYLTYLYQPVGKIKNETAVRIVKITSSYRISFWKSFTCFPMTNEVYSGETEKEYIICSMMRDSHSTKIDPY